MPGLVTVPRVLNMVPPQPLPSLVVMYVMSYPLEYPPVLAMYLNRRLGPLEKTDAGMLNPQSLAIKICKIIILVK